MPAVQSDLLTWNGNIVVPQLILQSTVIAWFKVQADKNKFATLKVVSIVAVIKLMTDDCFMLRGDPTQLSGRDIDQSGQTWSIVQCKCINSEFWHICTMFHNKMLWRQCNVSGLRQEIRQYLGPHMDWTVVLQLTQWCVSVVWWMWPFLLLALIGTKGTRQPTTLSTGLTLTDCVRLYFFDSPVDGV